MVSSGLEGLPTTRLAGMNRPNQAQEIHPLSSCGLPTTRVLGVHSMLAYSVVSNSLHSIKDSCEFIFESAKDHLAFWTAA